MAEPLRAVDLQVLRAIGRFEADGPTSVIRVAAATGLDHRQVVIAIDALRQHGLVDVSRSQSEEDDWMLARVRDAARRLVRQAFQGGDEECHPTIGDHEVESRSRDGRGR